MLMSPNKDETAVHGCHCQGDMAVRMRKVLQTAGWVFECVTCFFRAQEKTTYRFQMTVTYGESAGWGKCILSKYLSSVIRPLAYEACRG